MKKSRRSLLRLADNPYGDEDAFAPPGDEMGGDEMGGEGEEEEDPFGEAEPEDEMSGMYSMRKGRRVSGPRMKLSAEQLNNRMAGIERAVVDLAETVSSLAQSNSVVGKAVLARLQKEDEDDEKDEKEDKAKVGKARLRKEDYESDTGIGGTKDAGDDRTAEDETKNELGITEGDLTKAKIAKDDEASSFGEKDDDMPGNKPAGIDEKDKGPGDYLIQGDSSDGPGPTVSAAFKADLDKAVSAVYAKHGVIMKARGPRTGTGGSEQSIDVDSLFSRAREMSFRELNRKRVEVGDLPDGLI